MWGDKDRGLQVKDRNKLFNTTLASRAVCEVLNWELSGSSEGPLRQENVYFVCCTVLHDGSEQGGAVGKGSRKGGKAQGGKGEAKGAKIAHVGTHPRNMKAYMQQGQAQKVLAPSVVAVLEEISKRVEQQPLVYGAFSRRSSLPPCSQELVIATWCNAGEHRSVGSAEAILALAEALGMAIQGDALISKVREGFFP